MMDESELGWEQTQSQLFRLLDAQMAVDFEALQEESDPENAWYDWDDVSRELWVEWVREIDDLPLLESLCFRLWQELWQKQRSLFLNQ